jgi:excisionase family DNA binding protein
MPKKWMDLDEIAEHLGTSTRHVRRLVFDRTISSYKAGKYLRFDPVEVDEEIRATRRGPATKTEPTATSGKVRTDG